MTHSRLSDSYPVATLPRVAKVSLEERAVVSPLISPDSSVIDLGISKSIIASYLIKPSPKLVWSYPLSPKTVVDAMDTSVVDNVKRFAVGIHTGDKAKLLVLTHNEADPTSAAPIETDLTSQVKEVKFDDSEITVVYVNGSIERFGLENDKVTKDTKMRMKNSGTLAFCEFLTWQNQKLVLLIYKSKSMVTYQLVAITNNQVYEVETKSIQTEHDFRWAYNNGYIYQLNETDKCIDKISIAKFDSEKSISVEPLLQEGASSAIHAPCSDRLVLSSGTTIYIVNFTYGALLDSYVCKSSRSHANNDEVVVKRVVPIKSSGRLGKTVAVYLNLKPKDNNVDVNLISVDLGTNRLTECLGKAIIKPNQDKFAGVMPILTEEFAERSGEAGSELDEVFKTLRQCAEAKDVYKWERVLIPYMKNESWESIKQSISKTKAPKTKKEYTFQEMDEETDRVVDVRFIQKVVNLVLRQKEDEQVDFVDADFFPEHTLMYLLTSPVFPVEFTNGLLQLFYASGNFTLLRQAINTCPNLTVRELLIQVNNEVDDEVFVDLINRLCTEFSMGQITTTFKGLVVEFPDQINLDNLLVRLFKVPRNKNSLYLIESLVDVGGLFNWNETTVETLNEFIAGKIDALVQNSFNLTLTNQVLMAANPPKPARGHKKKKKKADADKLSEVDSLLSMTSHNGLESVQPIEISKKVPAYSVEKLAF
ncbi:hypothetical protein DIURU_003342 [Diutina rugosa]|uniref:Uncharacterized protein n=1 Tax=Diutina rugosa TaxID=5481 RepID=A0A642UKH6_DIURU|nr:uncharacterized protein DIURU_003342 [Diutina rugosa]KAA8900972.1 hypothetical protein DIURU_003342 [Diutina rugosa]